MNNEPEITDDGHADAQDYQPVHDANDVIAQPKVSVDLRNHPDLKLRYILPAVFSLFLLIMLLSTFAKVPEILMDFSKSILTPPNTFVKPPEDPNRFAEILAKIPPEVPNIKEIPEIPEFNFLGSLTQNIIIEERLDSVLFSLVYVNKTDKTDRVVVHLLPDDKEIISEIEIYSPNRMKDNMRIYKVDETLISVLNLKNRDVIVVQKGIDVDQAEALCSKIFPEILKPKK